MSAATAQEFSLVRIDGLVVSNHLEGAFSFLRRARGLLCRPPLRGDRAVWIRPGGSVHTFGMRFPIDVLFLDERLVVLGVHANVRPWRIRCAPRRTRSTVEMAAGRMASIGLKAGDELFAQPGESNDVCRSTVFD